MRDSKLNYSHIQALWVGRCRQMAGLEQHLQLKQKGTYEYVADSPHFPTVWIKQPLCTLFGYQGSVATFLCPKCLLFQNRDIPQNS